MKVLPPVEGERIAAFGFASTQILKEGGQQVEFGVNPITSPGVVTGVFPGVTRQRATFVSEFRGEDALYRWNERWPHFQRSGLALGLDLLRV
jgi:hypothetical protein